MGVGERTVAKWTLCGENDQLVPTCLFVFSLFVSVNIKHKKASTGGCGRILAGNRFHGGSRGSVVETMRAERTSGARQEQLRWR